MTWFWELLPVFGYVAWYVIGRSHGRRAERRAWATFGQERPSDITVRYAGSELATVECRMHREHVVLPVAPGNVGRAVRDHVRDAHPDREL